MSQEEWLQKRKEIVIPTNWGGDLHVRLMAVGLKKNITVITDYESGSVFGRYFHSTPPPIPKMKGGVFKPSTYGDIYRTKYCSPGTLFIIYNGCNHYDYTCKV